MKSGERLRSGWALTSVVLLCAAACASEEPLGESADRQQHNELERLIEASGLPAKVETLSGAGSEEVPTEVVAADADAPDGAGLDPNAVVERVVDGDTVVVSIDGQSETVRLIGIDTPESVARTRPVQCYGEEASLRLTEILPVGTAVTLIRDIEPRDMYGRLLAYVMRSKDKLFVNLELVRTGYAAVLEYPPNVYYSDLFAKAESSAMAADTGLWGVCGGADVPMH